MEQSAAVASAVKFNLCKKLCQLNKVIELFSFQVSEWEFRIQQLRKMFDPEIQDLLEGAWKEKEDIYKSLENDEQDINMDVSRFYTQKHAKMKAELDEMIENAKPRHVEQLLRISKELTVCTDILRTLIVNCNKKTDVVGVCVSREKKRISETCLLLKRKFQNDLKKHDTEATLRFEKFQKEASDKLQQLLKYHESEMSRVQTETSLPRLSQEEVTLLMNTTNALKNDIKKMKTSIASLKEEYADWMQSTKREIEAEIQKIQTVFMEHRAFVTKRDAEIEEIERPKIEMISQLKTLREEQKQRNQKELSSRRDANKSFILQLQQELIAKRAQKNAQFTEVDKTFDALQAKFEDDVSRLKTEFEEQNAKVAKKHKKLEERIKLETKSSAKRESKLRKELNSITETHQHEQKRIEGEYELELSDLNACRAKLRKDLQMRMHEIMNDDLQERLEAQTQLDCLTKERIALLETFDRTIKECEEDEMRAQNDLACQHQILLARLKTKLTEDLASEGEKQAKQIELARQKLAQDKDQRLLILEREIESELRKISDDETQNHWKQALQGDFELQFRQLQQELAGIQPPRVEDSEKFRELDLLECQKAERAQSLAHQRQTFLNQRYEEETMENSRHQRVLDSISNDTKQEQMVRACEEQLRALKESMEIEIHEYQRLLEEELATASRRDQVCDFSPEIDKLREELDQTRTNARDQVRQKKSQKVRETAEHRERNDAVSREYEARFSEINRKESDLATTFETDKAELERELEKLRVDLNQSILVIREHFESNVKEFSADYITIREKLLDEQRHCLDVSRTFESLIDERIMHMSWESEMKLSKQTEEYQIALDKVRNDWCSLASYLNECIEVATRKLEDAKNRYEAREARPCDQERIELLSLRFQAVQTHLSQMLRDFRGYKTMMVEQEQVINAKFGPGGAVCVPHFGADVRPVKSAGW